MAILGDDGRTVAREEDEAISAAWHSAAYVARLHGLPTTPDGEPDGEMPEETPEEEDARRERDMIAFYRRQIDGMESEATRSHEYWDLGGCDGPDPLAALQKALLQAARDVRAMRRHEHSYDDNDYCIVCGRDGRV